MKSLDVLVNGNLIGTLHNLEPLTFNFSQDCLASLLPNPFANGQFLALQDHHKYSSVVAGWIKP